MQTTKTRAMTQFVLITAGAAFLAGCAAPGTFRSAEEGGSIRGSLIRHAFSPDLVEIRLNGKTYVGEWREEPLSLEERKKVAYTHRTHMGQVIAKLSAEDGAQMRCQWRTHDNIAEGKCSANGRDYPLKLE